MTGAEYAKQRRDAARKKKFCLVCCKRPQQPGKSTCTHCTELKQSWALVSASSAVKRSLAKAVRGPDLFNVCCQAWNFHRDDCKEAA